MRRTSRISRPVDSVKTLLERTGPLAGAIHEQGARQRHWQRWLAARVPAALLSYVTGVVERDGELVVFAASAAWAVRLRYALAELEADLRAAGDGIERVRVRVLPAPRQR